MNDAKPSAMPPVSGLVQVAIPARDPAACAAFYETALKLPRLFGAGDMSFFDAGGVRLMVGPAGNLLPGAGAPLYFSTKDMRASQAELAAAGAHFHPDPQIVDPSQSPPLAIWFFADPEGNTLALMGPLS
jgi:predicted enzyme related to lactoylglutathione lyase